jgi:hypothetical protein
LGVKNPLQRVNGHAVMFIIVKHYFKSVHVSNLFWSREYNSAKEISKYPSFSKVGGNYPFTFYWKLFLKFKSKKYQCKPLNFKSFSLNSK